MTTTTQLASGLQGYSIAPPTISDVVDDVLVYDESLRNPVISIAAWPGINSESRIWLHCRCQVDGDHVDFIELANGLPANFTPDDPAITCELPLETLSTLANGATVHLVLIVSNDDSGEESSLASARYTFKFQQHSIKSKSKTNINYSRWMTNIGNDIRQLKIHDLVLPEAHNAGIDQEGTSGIAYQWAACQDDTFSYQLRHGARALDLRLYDRGASLIFKHNGHDANRYLSSCLHAVSGFARSNPGEIVILDFHEVFANGREHEAVELIQFHLRNQCIPPSASDMTIGQIRDRFPGHNVVIAWNHHASFCWRKVEQTWTGKSLNSTHDINQHMHAVMQAPPTGHLWSMFACGYTSLGGPTRFNAGTSIWTNFFNRIKADRYRQPSKGNMINIDFFAGTGVVDRCIAATRDRAQKARVASPVQLTAHNITINSIELRWAAPADSERVISYALYANDQPVVNQVGTAYVFTGLAEAKTYRLRVVAHFPSGEGAASEIAVVTRDETKPSKPTGLKFLFIEGIARAALSWSASTDNVAIHHYQVYANGLLLGTTGADSRLYMVEKKLLTFKVRAVDAAGNFAESDSLTMPLDRLEPGKPSRLSASITHHLVALAWTASTDHVALTGYQIFRDEKIIGTVKTTFYNDAEFKNGTYVYKVRALNSVGNYADSELVTVKVSTLVAPPRPIP